MPQDTDYMREAIALAATNAPRQPFGAVIVDPRSGAIVARGWNRVGESPLWHGEIDALNALVEQLGADPPAGLVLYTTAEPCPMCTAAALWTGISRIVFGVSIDHLRRWGWRQIGIPATEVVSRMAGASCDVTGGVLEAECARLFEGLA